MLDRLVGWAEREPTADAARLIEAAAVEVVEQWQRRCGERGVERVLVTVQVFDALGALPPLVAAALAARVAASMSTSESTRWATNLEMIACDVLRDIPAGGAS
jgi:hypothetical protein